MIDTFIESARGLDTFPFLQCVLTLREKVIGLMLEKGVLPPFKLIQLFPMIRKYAYHFERDVRINNYVALLKKHLTDVKKDSYEYFLIVDLLFVLDMFNGELEKGFFDYFSALVKSNIFEAYKYPEAYRHFTNILGYCNISDIEMVEYVGTLLHPDVYFENDLEVQSSLLLWIMTVIYNKPNYSASTAFFELEKSLNDIMLIALKLDRLGQAMAIYNVAHHLLGNLFQTQEEMATFNTQFTKPIALQYKKYAHALSKPTIIIKNKKKIAIIRDRLVNNSPHMVEYSLVKMLMKEGEFTNRYDLYIYSAGCIEKDLDNEKIISAYQQLGVTVKVIPKEWYVKGYYYDHLEKAKIIRNDMLREGIDMMIGTVGHNNVIDFLFATRTAPHQIYWSHGNYAYDIHGLDLRITHSDEAAIPSGLREGFPYRFFFAPYDLSALRGNALEATIVEERQKYPSDTIILGSIGRIVKLENDAYLEAVAEIMRRNSKTIYLACGSGESAFVRARLKRLGIEERFYFTGFVDPHLYGHLIDLYLDTFPMGSGEALNEYLAKEKIAVILLAQDHPIIRELFRLGKENSYQRIHAYSRDDYIELADRILNDPDLRNQLIQEAHERVSIHMPNMSRQTVKTFLRSLAGEAK